MDVDTLAFLEGEPFERHVFTATNGETIPYRLLAPSRVQPGIRYPLVVQLHGSGAIGTDNERQLSPFARSWAAPSIRERYPAYVIVPQFPVRSANYSVGQHELLIEAAPLVDGTVELINEIATRHPVDRQRIYAYGFSMGGSTAWLLEARQPSLLAAMMTIAAIAPGDAQVETYRRVPILMIHGNADTENVIDADRRFFATVKHAGGDRLWFREYEGLDHALPGDMYPDTWWRDWLFSQKQR